MRFFNSKQKEMSFADVIASIQYFIKLDPDSGYKLAVGTDSQVMGGCTCFATGIHIHRIGQGAWCCINKTIEYRPYKNLREKISRETVLTYEMMNMLNDQLFEIMYNFSCSYKNFDMKLEAHLDVGTNGATRTLIREMTGYFEGLGMDTRIKPEAFVASCYANRHSKNLRVG